MPNRPGQGHRPWHRRARMVVAMRARDVEVFGEYTIEDSVMVHHNAFGILESNHTAKAEQRNSSRDSEVFDDIGIEIPAKDVKLPRTLFKLHSRLSARDLEFFETESNPCDETDAVDDDALYAARAGCRDAEVFENYKVAEVPANLVPSLRKLPKLPGVRDREVLEFDCVPLPEPPVVQRRPSGRDDEF